jgi:hypothetical protein
MPAGSDRTAAVSVPHTFRPFGVRLAIAVFGTVLLVAAAATWFAFPPHIRAEFTLFQRATLLAFGLMLYAIGYGLARSRVVAREDSVTIVNGYRSRRFEWNEVIAVTLRRGSPWAVLDLSDGTSVAAMGIQGSDGDRAMLQARQLRTLVERHTR